MFPKNFKNNENLMCSQYETLPSIIINYIKNNTDDSKQYIK